MDREETKKIIRIMCASYPNYKPADISETIDIWTSMLSDYSYEHIALALKSYISTSTSGFAPSIGEIIQKASSFTQHTELNELEAWSLVSKALSNGYYGADEEFEKLPPLVQKAVGSPANIREWAQLDFKALSVIQSNFERVYSATVKRAEEYSRLPENVKALMQSMKPNPKLEDREVKLIDG